VGQPPGAGRRRRLGDGVPERLTGLAVDLLAGRGVPVLEHVQPTVAAEVEPHWRGCTGLDEPDLVPTVDAGPGRDAGGGDVERLGVVVARRRALDRAGAQAATGERRPDRAGVLTAERLRGRDDAVAPGDEAGA